MKSSEDLAEIVVDGLPYRLAEGLHRIGRNEGNEIPVDHESVSAFHATLCVQKGQYILSDQGSTNGTFLNGQKIIAAPVANGDRLSVGSVEMSFKCLSQGRSIAVTPPSRGTSTPPPSPQSGTVPPPSSPSTPDAQSPSPQKAPFSWWPEGQLTRRIVIVLLSLMFVVSALSSPAGGLVMTGIVYLLITFFRWLTLRTIEAFRAAPAPSTSIGWATSIDTVRNAIETGFVRAQPHLVNLRNAAVESSKHVLVRLLPLADRLKEKWPAGIAFPNRRTVVIAGVAAFILLIVLFSDSHDAPQSESSDISYSQPDRENPQSSDDSQLISLVERAMREETNRNNSNPIYGIPGNSQTSGSGSSWHLTQCSPCFGRGTITTPSGYTTTCASCGGTGKVRAGGPQIQAIQKY